MATKYAENTTVPSEKSRAEIEKHLNRYGADSFMYGTKPGMAIVAFTYQGMQCKITLPLPDPQSDEFVYTPAKKLKRCPAEQEKAYEQAVRRKWRVLANNILAKLSAIDEDISTFEHEFLDKVVMGNGRTFGEHYVPQIRQACSCGNLPALLPGLED